MMVQNQRDSILHGVESTQQALWMDFVTWMDSQPCWGRKKIIIVELIFKDPENGIVHEID